MKKLNSIIKTLSLVGIVSLLSYGLFIAMPTMYEKYLYIEVMQACTNQRLYMSEEVTRAFNDISKTASDEETEMLRVVTDNATAYFHSPEYYQECQIKTLEEWSLNN